MPKRINKLFPEEKMYDPWMIGYENHLIDLDVYFTRRLLIKEEDDEEHTEGYNASIKECNKKKKK